MASASSPQRNVREQPRETATRTARTARNCLLVGGVVILGWTGVGSYQFAATYGSWYEHTIFIGGTGAFLAIGALMTAHRVAAWHRPTRAVSIALCLLTVAAITAAGTLAGARAHEQDADPAVSESQGQAAATEDGQPD